MTHVDVRHYASCCVENAAEIKAVLIFFIFKPAVRLQHCESTLKQYNEVVFKIIFTAQDNLRSVSFQQVMMMIILRYVSTDRRRPVM